MQIFNCYRPMDLMESFRIQAWLLAGEKDSGSDKVDEWDLLLCKRFK